MEKSAKTILLVEDEAIIALLEKRWLVNEGFNIIHVVSGEDAIRKVRENPSSIDLILMDIDLGREIDGTQAAREILKDHDIPLLFLSSHTEKGIVDRTEEITSYGYVVKGSDNTVLLASIRMAFKLFNAHRDLRLKEAARKESEDKYRLLFENMRSGFALYEIIYDENGLPADYRFLAVNPAYEKLTGKSAEIFVNKKLSQVLNNSLKQHLEVCSRVALTGEPLSLEYYSEPLEKFLDIFVFKPGDGLLAVMFSDVSERRKAEEKLIHSYNLLKYFITHARSAIAIHDKDLRYLYVSNQYLKEYNIKDKDIIGKHHYEVFPGLPQKWRKIHQLALKGIISSAEEDPYLKEDGTVVYTRWECRPWHEVNGKIGGIILYTQILGRRE